MRALSIGLDVVVVVVVVVVGHSLADVYISVDSTEHVSWDDIDGAIVGVDPVQIVDE